MKFSPHHTDPPAVNRRPVTSPGLPAAGVSCRGFTLIELLVVVGIIAVLAGISLPVFSRVQAKARSVKCASNMRQIGVGMLSYADEHNTQLPPGPTWDTDISKYLGIAGYQTAASILTCPEDRRQQTMAAGQYARSYTANGGNADYPTYGVLSDDALPASRRLTLIHGATTIMLLENWSDYIGNAIDNEQFKTPFASVAPYVDVAKAPRLSNGAYYHGATENYVFVDGHVESLDPAIPCAAGKVLWEAQNPAQASP